MYTCEFCGRDTPNDDEICSKCRSKSRAARMANQRGETGGRTMSPEVAQNFGAWEEYCKQYDDD